MASLLSPRRTAADISLEATEPDLELTVPINAQPSVPTVGWLLGAVGAALVTAVAGWVLTTGLTVLGWLSAEPGTLAQALRVGTELWLLGNGGGARIGANTLTLVPWGITLLIAFSACRCSAFVTGLIKDRSAGIALTVPAILTLSYLTVVISAALVLGTPERALRAGALMTLVIGAATLWGCMRARGWSSADVLPVRLRALPRAVLAAQLVMVAGGAGLLVSALLTHLGRVEGLQAGLDPGIAGGIALLCAQLAYAPNAIVWVASYALGAGFTLGSGSMVAPAGTDVGLLPGVPLLGAMPAQGPGDVHQLWWLATGVVAGAAAATVVVLARPTARADEAGLVGGLAGVVAGLTFTGAAWLTSGDLGAQRLADLGPRLVPLLVMATTTMGLSGVLTGLLLGLRRRRPTTEPRTEPDPNEADSRRADDGSSRVEAEASVG